MESVEKLTHAGRTINIYIDPEPLNPRKEWDNGTVMVHWHRRYNLCDKRIEPMTREEIVADCEAHGDKVLAIAPLYLYDHSGLSISTGSFACTFDSGQVGWVYITQSKSDEMGFGGFTEEQLHNVIVGEVKTYDAYLTGQVYGYEVTGVEGDHLEACWGYFGKDDCIFDAKTAASACEDPAVQRMAEELASRATYAGVSP